MVRPADNDDELQLALLSTRPGEPDSGLTRYAAAMHFYQRGLLGAPTLEVYRICSPFDGEDPLPTLRRLGLDDDIACCRKATGDPS